MNRHRGMKLLQVALALALALAGGCAGGAGQAVSVREGAGPIEMTASNFDFKPSIISANPGDVLVLRIRNVSGTDHNFTIESPDGKVLQDVDLPEKSTRDVQVEFPVAGTYPFYCGKPFHPTLGMTGRVEVGAGR